MHLFDPERPKMGTRPRVLGQMFVVPSLYVDILEAEFVQVRLMLPSVESGFTWHAINLPEMQLSEFVGAYRQDPEAVLLRYFNWQSTAVHFDPHFGTDEERNAHNATHFPNRPKAMPRRAPTSGPASISVADLADMDF